MGLILQFACFIFAILPAAIHNFIYIKKNKDAPSFFLGYLVAYYLIIWPIFMALSTFGVALATPGSFFGMLLVGAIIFSSIGIFCLSRNQALFYLGSLMTFNIAIWISVIVFIFTGAKKVWRKEVVPPPLPPIDEEVLYITHDGEKQLDPMTLNQITHAVAIGRLSKNHFFWNVHTNEWRPISEIIKEFESKHALKSAIPYWHTFRDPLTISLALVCFFGVVKIGALTTSSLSEAKPSAEVTDINTWGVGGGKTYATYYKLRIENPPTVVLSKTGGSIEFPLSIAAELQKAMTDMHSSLEKINHYEDCLSRRVGNYIIYQRNATGGYIDPYWGRRSARLVEPFLRISHVSDPDGAPAIDEITEVDFKKLVGLLNRIPEVEADFKTRATNISTWQDRISLIWCLIILAGIGMFLASPLLIGLLKHCFKV